MGRTDDVINVAGHRLSTGSIEAVLAAHPAVAECAVIGVADELKGQVPRGFVVLEGTARRTTGLADELIAAVREHIGAVAAFQGASMSCPRCRRPGPGKILRKTMRGIADGRDEPVPSTIEDPAVLDALKPILDALTVRCSQRGNALFAVLEQGVEAPITLRRSGAGQSSGISSAGRSGSSWRCRTAAMDSANW